MVEIKPYFSVLNMSHVSCLQCVRTQNREIFSPGQTLFIKYSYPSTSEIEKACFCSVAASQGACFVGIWKMYWS